MSSDLTTNISVFREIFCELAKFSSRVEQLLSQHEKQVKEAMKNGIIMSSIPSNAANKKRKKEIDPDAPHRPPSSYFLYQNEIREKLRQEHPNLSIGELAKLTGAKWSELTEEQKRPYIEQSEKLRGEFKKEMSAYEESKKEISGTPTNGAKAASPRAEKKEKVKSDSKPDSNIKKSSNNATSPSTKATIASPKSSSKTDKNKSEIKKRKKNETSETESSSDDSSSSESERSTQSSSSEEESESAPESTKESRKKSSKKSGQKNKKHKSH